jgi:transglutaminase-like putative cysteine protease
MSLDLAARVSGYLTLALTAGCLACADATFIPLLPPLLVPALLLFVVAFFAEGRGWVMPPWAANVAALGIVVVTAACVTVYRLRSSDGAGEDLPLVLMLLPGIGPVLILLVLVKLFRPKTERDAWALQGLGLLMAGLACVLADGGPFGLLLLAYVVCGTWHLALAYLRREERRAAAPAAAPVRVPWRGAGLLCGTRWSLAAAAMGLPAFLLAPRGDRPWDPLLLLGPQALRTGVRGEVGLSGEIDLNRTETLDLTDDVALRVEAFRDTELTEPKMDLSPNQRWRGKTLDVYEHGRWGQAPAMTGVGALGPDDLKLVPRAPDVTAMQQRQLPDLGPGQFYLRLTTVPRVTVDPVLAEPAVLRGRALPFVLAPGEPRARLLFQVSHGTVVPFSQRPTSPAARYLQVVPRAPEPGLGEPVTLTARYEVSLMRQPVAGLEAWTRDLARRLAGRPGFDVELSDLELLPNNGGPRGPERLARALATYLASSGDFAYSFEQERIDADIDPTLDFLQNVRHGPCTRFASALALMLRSLDVPSRVVLGYRGCEPLGDGSYQVLASQAHAWVEALVSRPGPDGNVGRHWLALDPTPPSDAVPRPTFSLWRWLEKHQDDPASIWRSYVVDYNPARQDSEVLKPIGDIYDRARDSLPQGPSVSAVAGAGTVVVAATVVAVYLVRRRRRGAAARRTVQVAFYKRLLDVLARIHGLQPRPVQTPREFATDAGLALRTRTAAAAVADVPAEVAELFYRVAFGERPLTDDEARAVDSRLDALAAAR